MRKLRIPEPMGFRRNGDPIYPISGGAVAQGFIPIRETVAVTTGLGLLERESVVAALLWRDPITDWVGKFGDTVSIRVPAYAVANVRDLRSGDPRVRSKLHERKVDVTLDKDIQIDVALTDEELTLDIRDFTAQVIKPMADGIARGYEDAAISVMQDATYQHTVDVGATNVDNPDTGVYAGLVDARTHLNDSRVPMQGRAAVLGSSLEAQALKDPRLARADQSGSTSALRDAFIGRLAGFDIYTAPGLDPDKGYAFHKSAFVLTATAPIVPAGAPWGERSSRNGYTMRFVQILDPNTIEDIVAADAWLGTGVVTDSGAIDGNGRFTPSVDPDESGADDLFVRAVELQAAS